MSVVLGIGFAVGAMAAMAWHQWPVIDTLESEDFTSRFLVTFGVPFGLLMLLGAVTAVTAALSRRLPWLATAAGVVLLYGVLASAPSGVQALLPYPLSWRFAGRDTFALLVGFMLATAVFAFVSHRRSRSASTIAAGVSAATSMSRGRAVPWWDRHLVAAVAGIVIGIGIQASTVVLLRPAFFLSNSAAWWSWVMLGILLLVGAVTAVVVLLASRMPWLPTALALTLVYGTLAALRPVTLGVDLPSFPDWFQPIVFFPSMTTLAIVTGATVAAAVWAWWSHLRRRRLTENSPYGTPSGRRLPPGR